MYYEASGKQITRDIMLRALTRLGELLRKHNKRLELVCCGGVVSVLYHGSRQMTHDVDVLFPNNPHVTKLLKHWLTKLGRSLDWSMDREINGLTTVLALLVFNLLQIPSFLTSSRPESCGLA